MHAVIPRSVTHEQQVARGLIAAAVIEHLHETAYGGCIGSAR